MAVALEALLASHTGLESRRGTLTLALPFSVDGLCPSDDLDRLLGQSGEDAMLSLRRTRVPALVFDAHAAVMLLMRMAVNSDGDQPVATSITEREMANGALDSNGDAFSESSHSSRAAVLTPTRVLGESTRFWGEVALLAMQLVAHQRFVPTASLMADGGIDALWQPWISDHGVKIWIDGLVAAMPGVCRAASRVEPTILLLDALRAMTDAIVRSTLIAEGFNEAIDGDDPADPHVLWLSGLLAPVSRLADTAHPALRETGPALVRESARWLSMLEEADRARAPVLRLQLHSPEGDVPADAAAWQLDLGLHVPAERPGEADADLDAASIWNVHAGKGSRGPHTTPYEERLLSELAGASRLYPRLEEAMAESEPTSIGLTTAESYAFLRETMPLLEEAGYVVVPPPWWEGVREALGMRMIIEPAARGTQGASSSGGSSTASPLGLQSLVNFRWQAALGDHNLTAAEMDALASAKAPLMRLGGQWVEVEATTIDRLRAMLRENRDQNVTLLEALRRAYSPEADDETPESRRPPVIAVEARGWIGEILNGSAGAARVEPIDQPASFHGELRAYQRRGLNWLAFLDQHGFGACLADDMGLGKTIQLISLLLHEREQRAQPPTVDANAPANACASSTSLNTKAKSGGGLGPTLLVVPTSLVGNWVRELARFAPSLTVHVQHGQDRPSGLAFTVQAAQRDVVITTYALLARDAEQLRSIEWRRIVLDEAQSIKNPPTKQTAAIRSLRAGRRIALTGTPVENRLSELWSIMEFCNPGYLGSINDFRRRFSTPIERRRDATQASRLKALVRPFILRRVKSDPTVITDLPPCVETKAFATLTPQQAAMYESVVRSLLAEADRADGIRRRGVVLAGLMRLKQICDHPLLISPDEPLTLEPERDDAADSPVQPAWLLAGVTAADAARQSGKSARILTLLEEVLAVGERALVFTQFRRMGHLLMGMIRGVLGCEAMFLHGGTPTAKRQEMIDHFQLDEHGPRVFILSLRAGGLGLNLTAANHVFHYDRWWNPAVESQATDRAHRIGQTRSVQVHKFVCQGTLEERIDQMIEQKSELARNIIGSGEQWLTELTTAQLRDLLILRTTAVEAEP